MRKSLVFVILVLFLTVSAYSSFPVQATDYFALAIDRSSLVLPTSGQKNAGLDFSLTLRNEGHFVMADWAIKSWDSNPGTVILEDVANSGFGRSIEVGEYLIKPGVYLHHVDWEYETSSDHGIYKTDGKLYFMATGIYHFTVYAVRGVGDLLDESLGPLTQLDSLDFTVNIAESSSLNEWTIAEFHTFRNGLEVKSRYPVDEPQNTVPLGQVYLVFWYQAGSNRWKGTLRAAPLRLAVHTKNIGGMMWSWGPAVTALYYTLDCALCYGDASFVLSTEQKAVVNIQLGEPIPTRIQVRVYDDDNGGQLMSTMSCAVNTEGNAVGDTPPVFIPLSLTCNTNEWVVPRVDDYHVEAGWEHTASGTPRLVLTAKVTVDKEYTQRLDVPAGTDTYADFHVGLDQPPDQTVNLPFQLDMNILYAVAIVASMVVIVVAAKKRKKT